jgi:hypothetical protein
MTGDGSMYEAVDRTAPSYIRRLRLQPGEQIVYECLPSARWTWSLYLVTFGLWAIWRKANRFVVTTYRVVVVRGIVSRYERAVPLTHVQDVTLRTPVLGPSYVHLSIQGMGPLSRANARELADVIQGQLIRYR